AAFCQPRKRIGRSTESSIPEFLSLSTLLFRRSFSSPRSQCIACGSRGACAEFCVDGSRQTSSKRMYLLCSFRHLPFVRDFRRYGAVYAWTRSPVSAYGLVSKRHTGMLMNVYGGVVRERGRWLLSVARLKFRPLGDLQY
ncbi:hypothetical protein RSAG8_02257, partial [Rhizoctonia solani AG-8 WAC10335]